MAGSEPPPQTSYRATHGDPSTFAIEADITAHTGRCMYLGAIYLWIGETRFGAYESEPSQWLNPTIGELAGMRASTPLEIERTVMAVTPRAALSRIDRTQYGGHESDEHVVDDHYFLTGCIFSGGEAFDPYIIALPRDDQHVRILACERGPDEAPVPSEVLEVTLRIESFYATLDGFLDSIPWLDGFRDPRKF